MAVITISRQFGAGGKTMAKQVAEQLNYTIVHEEIIEKLAEMAETTPNGIRAFEAEETWLLRKGSDISSSKRFVDRIFDSKRNYIDGQLYKDLLTQIIPQVVEEGNVVILGRGAQFILRSRPDTYHILLVAQESDRILFMEKVYGLNREDARTAVAKQGKRRMKLMKLFHSEDYDQPLHYDLVLNMSKMSLDQAVEMVCELVGEPI
jgi:cytidylate kinase